jgi:uncharacterized OB-fold protein
MTSPSPATAPAPAHDDAAVFAAYPEAVIDQDTVGHYRGWLDRRLLINRCNACGHWHHPPAPLCPRCWSFDVVPTEVSGGGTIHLLILVHQGPPAPGIDYSAAPHPVATVDLVEQAGLRFTSTVVGVSPGELRIGQPVVLTWIDRAGSPYPAFRPADGTTGGPGHGA